MQIVREVNLQETLRRFAIGEVDSEFYSVPDPVHRIETKGLLTSGDPAKEVDGIKRALVCRAQYIGTVPQDTRWFLSRLSISEGEFARLRVIRQQVWLSRSGPSRKLIDAAKFLRDNPGTDPRIDSILAAYQQGNVEMTGITLLAERESGPFTVVEGTGRLISIYLRLIADPKAAESEEEIEVVLGLSNIQWAFS